MSTSFQSSSQLPVSSGGVAARGALEINTMKIGDTVYNGINKSILWTVTGIDGEWLSVEAPDPDGGLHVVGSLLHVDDVKTK